MKHKKSQNKAQKCSDSTITMGFKLSAAFRERIAEEGSAPGSSISAIARKLSINRKTVRRWLSGEPPKPRKVGKPQAFLRANQEIVRSLFVEAEMNCAVVQHRLLEDYGISVPLRMLERFLKTFRAKLKTPQPTIRFETAPGQQMQIDFGEKDLVINGSLRRVHFLAAILSFSRRCFVKAYWTENQDAWLDGIESALHCFGGVPVWIVCDNTRSLIANHRERGEEKFTERVKYFSAYYKTGFAATAPYKPRSKGKVERLVRYIKENALVGRAFQNISELNKWLEVWAAKIADQRKLREFTAPMNTPIFRFEAEKKKLGALRPRIFQVTFERRKADDRARIQVENQKFELPESFANQTVQIQMGYSCTSVTAAGTNRHFNLNRAKALYLKDPDRWTHLNQKQKSLPSMDSVKEARKQDNSMLPTPSKFPSAQKYDLLFGINHDADESKRARNETQEEGRKSK